MSRKSKLVSVSCALALGLGATATAQAAQPQIKVLSHPAEQFQRSIDIQKLELPIRIAGIDGPNFCRMSRIAAMPLPRSR